MKRPFSVAFLGFLFIAEGLLSLIYHLLHGPLDYSSFLVSLAGIVAIVGGVFLLKGRNWARWLLLIWLASHVAVGALNSLGDALVHLVLLVAIAYFLLTPPDSKYFNSVASG